MVYREGSEPDASAVATGSHIDAIPYSGKYDGVVGVLGAIEAINLLRRYLLVVKESYFNFHMSRIWLVMFLVLQIRI